MPKWHFLVGVKSPQKKQNGLKYAFKAILAKTLVTIISKQQTGPA